MTTEEKPNASGNPPSEGLTPEDHKDPTGWGIQKGRLPGEAAAAPPAPDAQGRSAEEAKPTEEAKAAKAAAAPPAPDAQGRSAEEAEAAKAAAEAASVEQFDAEKLTPGQKAEFDRLSARSRRADELESKVGEQGRELGAAREAVKAKGSEHQQIMEAGKKQFEANLGQSLQIEQNSLNQALAWEQQAQELQEAGDMPGAEQARQNAGGHRQRAIEERQTSDMNLRIYNEWRRNSIQEFSQQMEEALFSVPEYKHYREFRDKLPAFCQDMGLNLLEVRGDLQRLQRTYGRLVASERGSDANIAQIKADAEKAAIEAGARRRGAAGPAAGSSGRETLPKKDKSWEETHFPAVPQRSSNPDITS